MGVRNCQEIGENLQKIINRLMANDRLVKLLYYADSDPLSHPDLTPEQKQSLIFNKLIKIVPKVSDQEVEHSVLTVRVMEGKTIPENGEFKNIYINVEVFIPWTEWIIKDSNLRPFAILGEVQKSLQDKTINGLGKMTGGDFAFSYNTAEMACYDQAFTIITYD